MSEIKNPLQLMYTGQAGEYRVASELLLRGINVYISRLDSGVDLMLQDGRKIQVKTAHLFYNKATKGSYYHFVLKGYFFLKGGERKKTKSEVCDFFVFWCIEANSFFIVPCEDLKGLSGLDLYPATMGASPNRKTKFPRDRSKYSQYKERWDLLTNVEIKGKE